MVEIILYKGAVEYPMEDTSDRSMDGCVIYLTGEQLSINTHRPTEPKKMSWP